MSLVCGLFILSGCDSEKDSSDAQGQGPSSSNTGGTGQNTGGDGQAVAACQALVDAQCNQYATCAPWLWNERQQAACLARKDICFKFGLSGISFGVNIIDTLDNCKQVISAKTCDEFRNESGCPNSSYKDDTDIVGSLPNGASCLAQNQCASGWCKGASDYLNEGSDVVCGVCSDPLGEGGSCCVDKCGIEWAPCKSPLVCSSYRGKCVKGAAEGEKCSTSVDPTTLSTTPCAAGLTCTSSICKPQKSADPPLSSPVGKKEGENCSSSSGERCESFLFCKQGKCEKYTLSAVGQPCDVSVGQFCEDGLICASGVCSYGGSPDVGEPCDDAHKCGSGVTCLEGVCHIVSPPKCQ